MGKIKEFFKEKVEDFADFVEEHPIVYCLGCFTIGSIIGQNIVNNQVDKRLKKLEKESRHLYENDSYQLKMINEVAQINGKKFDYVKTGTDDLGANMYQFKLVDKETESKENAD